MSFPPELQEALLGRRVVFLRGRLDHANASNAMAQLLMVATMAAGRPLELYVDSPGGSIGAALSVYDVVQTLGTPVSTTCIGTVGGAAVLVLAAGAAGLRFALPHARIHLLDEPLEVAAASANRLATEVQEATRLRARWQEAVVRHTGRAQAELTRDLAAGRWLTAPEAHVYGVIDSIVPST